jgi:AraC family transcriptional regulator of adaptative response / DNA-3-methyladenine glycosylase II
MRLIGDGVVEREGVEGLARRVGYTPRHLNRVLTTQLGAGPLALARARRAQTARTLIQTTAMSFADVAFASGFASIRQFNDTVRAVYGASPSQLRGTGRRGGPAGQIELKIAVRAPFSARDLLDFLRPRVVSGVETAGIGWYARTLALPHGHGWVRLSVDETRRDADHVSCLLEVTDLRDVGVAVERCRRLVDADCDPVAVDSALGEDPALAPLVAARPGLRVPGHVDGHEVAVRAVVGQQISVAGAATILGRLTGRFGETVEPSATYAGLSRLFPTAAALAEVDPEELPMPRTRGRALNALCRALADGDVCLDRSADRGDVRRRLLALPGIGPWTADYIALRALGDPDVFLPTDVGVRQALASLGAGAPADASAWRPWRSYALMHLWSSLHDHRELRSVAKEN